MFNLHQLRIEPTTSGTKDHLSIDWANWQVKVASQIGIAGRNHSKKIKNLIIHKLHLDSINVGDIRENMMFKDSTLWLQLFPCRIKCSHSFWPSVILNFFQLQEKCFYSQNCYWEYKTRSENTSNRFYSVTSLVTIEQKLWEEIHFKVLQLLKKTEWWTSNL